MAEAGLIKALSSQSDFPFVVIYSNSSHARLRKPIQRVLTTLETFTLPNALPLTASV